MAPANTLLKHSDQHRHDCIRVNAHPRPQIADLDRLAQPGAAPILVLYSHWR